MDGEGRNLLEEQILEIDMVFGVEGFESLDNSPKFILLWDKTHKLSRKVRFPVLQARNSPGS